jgi:hypothetical protein
MVWAIIVLLLLILILLQNRLSSGFSDTDEIPKTIWTFWDGPDPPETVKKCMRSWRKHNPDHSVVLLNRDNLAEFLPGVDIFGMKMATTPQRTADLVRVHVLAEHGGIWADATIMFTASLDFVHKNGHGRELVAYQIGSDGNKTSWPILENWFFACPPKSEFVTRWRDAFVKINDFDTPEEYNNYVKSQGVSIDSIEPGMQSYLTMHVAAQYVMQKQMTPEEISTKLHIEKSEEGPFRHLARNDWDTYTGLLSLCNQTPVNMYPIIKFRGTDRDHITEHKELECLWRHN